MTAAPALPPLFHCLALDLRFTPEECARRQGARQLTVEFTEQGLDYGGHGRRSKGHQVAAEGPAFSPCGIGCDQGRGILVQLGLREPPASMMPAEHCETHPGFTFPCDGCLGARRTREAMLRALSGRTAVDRTTAAPPRRPLPVPVTLLAPRPAPTSSSSAPATLARVAQLLERDPPKEESMPRGIWGAPCSTPGCTHRVQPSRDGTKHDKCFFCRKLRPRVGEGPDGRTARKPRTIPRKRALEVVEAEVVPANGLPDPRMAPADYLAQCIAAARARIDDGEALRAALKQLLNKS